MSAPSFKEYDEKVAAWKLAMEEVLGRTLTSQEWQDSDGYGIHDEGYSPEEGAGLILEALKHKEDLVSKPFQGVVS